MVDEGKTGWKKEDAVILSQHHNIASSLGNSLIYISIPQFLLNSRLLFANLDFMMYGTWQENNKDHYFKRVDSSTWIETLFGITEFTFKLTSQTGDKVVLFASDRNFYVQLDSTSAKWGSSLSAIVNKFNDGKWVS